MYSWLLRHTVMPVLLKYTNSRYWDAYRQMLRFERASLQDQKTLQWQRFEQMLRHAYENVPLHRRQMDQAGVTPDQITCINDLHRVPITTKQQIQRNFPDRVTAENSDRNDWQYVSTRGTANRLMVIHDFHKRDMVRATAARAMLLSGGYQVGHVSAEIPPDVCNIVCGDEGQTNDGVLPHVWKMTRQRLWRDSQAMSDLRGLIERGWIFRRRTYQPFGPQGTNLPSEQMKGYIEALRRDRPFVLKALPTYLYEIARYVLQHGETPLPVHVVKPMGSSVSSKMKATIEAAFEGQYREDYGSAEFGDMACDCDQRDGLHVFMDQFVIEVVRDGRPVKPGQVGKILITDLSNRAMPMIRYEIGDVGNFIESPCDCGRPAPRLCVEGRLQDTLITRQGKVVTNDQVMDFFYNRDDVGEFQLVEKKQGKMELMVVSSNGQVPDGEQITSDLREFLEDDVAIDVYPVQTIKPEASGKFRFVKSQSFQGMG